MYTLSEAIGWLGVVLSVLVTFPQLLKSIKAKSTKGVSLHAYQLLFLAVFCYLIRAIVIKEPIFIVSNAANLLLSASMLYLFKRYPECQDE